MNADPTRWEDGEDFNVTCCSRTGLAWSIQATKGEISQGDSFAKVVDGFSPNSRA